VASQGGGGVPPWVTPSRGRHPNEKSFFVGEFRKNTGPPNETTPKRSSEEKIGVTPPVAAPGDSNPSDATVNNYLIM